MEGGLIAKMGINGLGEVGEDVALLELRAGANRDRIGSNSCPLTNRLIFVKSFRHISK